jgi:hypothetical protein
MGELMTLGTAAREQLRRLCQTGQLVRVRRGRYAEPGYTDAPARAATERLDAVASHATAAAAWGIATLSRRDQLVWLTRPRRKQGALRDYPDVVLHHAALPDDHVTLQHGLPVTSVARTVVDLARLQPFRAGVVAADSALRQRLCEQEELVAVTSACRGWPGIRKARAVVGFADARAATPLESISRVAFHDYGLPSPLLQAPIGGVEPVDFLWDTWRVIGEADGLMKHTAADALRREKLREEALVQRGFTVFRWTWRDVYDRPDGLAYRAARILARHGWRTQPCAHPPTTRPAPPPPGGLWGPVASGQPGRVWPTAAQVAAQRMSWWSR